MEATEVISMHQAKSTLSRLVRRAAAGETVLIGPNGYAAAKLTSLDEPAKPKRRLGLLKGKLLVPDGFDATLPDDVLADFEGGRSCGARTTSPPRCGSDVSGQSQVSGVLEAAFAGSWQDQTLIRTLTHQRPVHTVTATI
jgi:antitoxin (DNA-binding transcriptional repressor) of toxin-antitoxin stability system